MPQNGYTQSRRHDSPDEPITGNTAPVQSVRLTFPKDPWQLIVATILAISVVMNVVTFGVIYYDKLEWRLSQDLTDHLQRDKINPLEAKTNQLEREIQSLQMRMDIRKELSR